MTNQYVRIDRSDGTRTYRGPLRPRRVEIEAAHWRECFPDYEVVVLPVAEARADVRLFDKATRVGVRYFPGAAIARTEQRKGTT